MEIDQEEERIKKYCEEQGMLYFHNETLMQQFHEYFSKNGIKKWKYPTLNHNVFDLYSGQHPCHVFEKLIKKLFRTTTSNLPKFRYQWMSLFFLYKIIRISWYFVYNRNYLLLLQQAESQVRNWIMYCEFVLAQYQRSTLFEVCH